MAQTNPPPGSSEEWFPVPGQARLLSVEHRPGEGEGAGGKAELAGPSPVVQHIIDQVDEVQPQLEVRPVGRDAVPEVARHQLAVRWGLGVAEHPVLPSLKQPGWWVSGAGLPQAKVCTDARECRTASACLPPFLVGEPTEVLMREGDAETGCPWSSPGPDWLQELPPSQEHQVLGARPHPGPALTEMASLVQVSMMGCNRLSNSFMSSWVSSRSFCICCSTAWATAAVTCS